jgi:hypothetical protein
MTMCLRFRVLVVLSFSLTLAIACRGGGSESPESSATQERPASVAPATAASAATAITAEDLAAYQRGIQKEIEAVLTARRAGAAATTAAERGKAAQGEWDTATIPQGAAASGLDEERYRAVRAAVHEVLQTLDFQGKIDGPLSIDLTRVDEATKARLSRDAFADLPADSAAVLREAVPRLTPVWSEYMTLSAVAG